MPGTLMQPNPYKEGTEDWYWYNDWRGREGMNWSRDTAMQMAGPGLVVGAPAKAGEAVLGSGAIRTKPASFDETVAGGGLMTKPIRAYHGSPLDVDSLKAGTSGNYGPATYFHIDPADAERYRPQGGRVYEADLNIQRPFEMDKPVSAEDASAILRASGNDKLADSVAASGKGYWSGNEFWHWGMGQNVDPAKKAAALKSAGFDSVIGDLAKQ